MARKSIILNDVGTSYVQQELLGFPDSIRIRRVTALKVSGSATTMGVRLKQRPDGSPIEDTVLEYPLAATVDEASDFVMFPYRIKDTDFGAIYVAAKADSSSNKIKIVIDYTPDTYVSASGSAGAGGAGGGEPSDGDKGDIAVTASGLIWTIENDAVTYAKMQEIATDSLVGRDAVGTGNPETIGLNPTLSMTGTGYLQRAALTGEVTASAGSNALVADKTMITNRTPVTAAAGDFVLISDVSNLDNLKKVTAQSIADLAVGSGISENLAIAYAIALG